MKLDLGCEWVCDFCGKKTFLSGSGGPPESFAIISFTASRSGFNYNWRWDICKKCLPGEFFKDPPEKKGPPQGLLRKVICYLRRGLWEK